MVNVFEAPIAFLFIYLNSYNFQVKKEASLKFVPDQELERFFNFKWYHFNAQSNLEWDTLIVLPQSKLIINIEVKSGSTINVVQSAADQTNRHLSIFKKVFGPLLSKKWQFLKAAHIPNLRLRQGNQPCEHCKQFIFKDLRYFFHWIDKITEHCKIYREEEYTKEYEDLLVGIIGYSLSRQTTKLNTQIIFPHELNRETEGMISGSSSGVSGENEVDRVTLNSAINGKLELDEIKKLCYMLTPQQLEALKDTSFNLIIYGDYGTGKTYCLKERCKKTAEKYDNKKIAYIDLAFEDDCLLHLSTENPDQGENAAYGTKNNLTIMDLIAIDDFKKYCNIDVITCKVFHDHYLMHKNEVIESGHMLIKSFLVKNKYEFVFIDEITRKEDFFIENISFCATTNIFFDNYIWINYMEYENKATVINWNKTCEILKQSLTCQRLSVDLKLQCLPNKGKIMRQSLDLNIN